MSSHLWPSSLCPFSLYSSPHLSVLCNLLLTSTFRSPSRSPSWLAFCKSSLCLSSLVSLWFPSSCVSCVSSPCARSSWALLLSVFLLLFAFLCSSLESSRRLKFSKMGLLCCSLFVKSTWSSSLGFQPQYNVEAMWRWIMWRQYESDIKVMWKRSCKNENNNNVKLNVGGSKPKETIKKIFQGSDVSRWFLTVCYARRQFFQA